MNKKLKQNLKFIAIAACSVTGLTGFSFESYVPKDSLPQLALQLDTCKKPVPLKTLVQFAICKQLNEQAPYCPTISDVSIILYNELKTMVSLLPKNLSRWTLDEKIAVNWVYNELVQFQNGNRDSRTYQTTLRKEITDFLNTTRTPQKIKKASRPFSSQKAPTHAR